MVSDRFGSNSLGIYPDEWHWREGISKPEKFREIVNAWPLDIEGPRFFHQGDTDGDVF